MEEQYLTSLDNFNAKDHITQVQGSPYLEVKWRLVWLRKEHPGAEITTHLVEHEPGRRAVFSCVISIPDDGGIATGWGSETIGDFHDYLEKAETKAVGRACAMLGFGTQFTDDLIVPRAPIAARPVVNGQVMGDKRDVGGEEITVGQIKFIADLRGQIGDDSIYSDVLQDADVQIVEGITKRKASELIDALKAAAAQVRT